MYFQDAKTYSLELTQKELDSLNKQNLLLPNTTSLVVEATYLPEAHNVCVENISIDSDAYEDADGVLDVLNTNRTFLDIVWDRVFDLAYEDNLIHSKFI